MRSFVLLASTTRKEVTTNPRTSIYLIAPTHTRIPFILTILTILTVLTSLTGGTQLGPQVVVVEP